MGVEQGGGAQRELRPPEVRQAEGQWYFEPRMDTNGHEWTRMNAGGRVVELRCVEALGGRGSC
ncbi:MAG: hypothetical protein ACK5FF_05450, partial [Planctomyces sp.]